MEVAKESVRGEGDEGKSEGSGGGQGVKTGMRNLKIKRGRGEIKRLGKVGERAKPFF